MSDAYLDTLQVVVQTEPSMLNAHERRSIERMALEQAQRAADLAKAEPLPILPLVSSWPFPVSEDDQRFLRINKISPA